MIRIAINISCRLTPPAKDAPHQPPNKPKPPSSGKYFPPVMRCLLASKLFRVIKFGNLVVWRQRLGRWLAVNAANTPPGVVSLVVERIPESTKPIAKPARNLRQTLCAKKDQHHCRDQNDLPTTEKECERDHTCESRLTTQAQRPGVRDATIATATLPPGSLQCMIRPRCHGVNLDISSSALFFIPWPTSRSIAKESEVSSAAPHSLSAAKCFRACATSPFSAASRPARATAAANRFNESIWGPISLLRRSQSGSVLNWSSDRLNVEPDANNGRLLQSVPTKLVTAAALSPCCQAVRAD